MNAGAKSRRARTIRFRAKRCRVRYAVVGLGHIAQSSVLPAFAQAGRNSVLCGLVSGDAVKLASVQRNYDVDAIWAYDQYDEMLASGEIDAVYIALPNDMHFRFASKALKAGVHVLCEKPLAPTAAECRRLVGLARSHRVKLMTAYRLHFERANLEVLDRVQAGAIGEPRIFDSLFTMQIRDRSNIRLSAARAGGPLTDIGIYCLNAARAVFRAEPTEVVCFTASSADRRFREVPEMVSALMRFPRERLATFTCSFGAADVSSYRIVGSEGEIRVEPAFHHADGLAYEIKTGEKKKRRSVPERDQFAPELLAFSDWIQGGDLPSASGLEGWADVRVIEALERSARRGGVKVRLGPVPRIERADLEQVVDAPAPAKPKLVRARSAKRARSAALRPRRDRVGK